MFKDLRNLVLRAFVSRMAQAVWLLVLFSWMIWAWRTPHDYWPRNQTMVTYMVVAAGLQLFGLTVVSCMYELTANNLFQARKGDPSKQSWNYMSAALSAFALLVGAGLVASTIFTEVGQFTIRLPGVTYFMPGSTAAEALVSAGLLTVGLLSFALVAFGTLFCGPVARRQGRRARSAPAREPSASFQ